MSPSQVVLGLDYGGTKIALAVSDLAGNQLGSLTMDSRSASGARESFGSGIRGAHELLTATTPNAALAAVGVATFGIPFDDRVELAPAIGGWGELAMGRELRAAFPGARIRMVTDVKAAAEAEARWGALAGCDPAVYLNLGTGLSIALVIGGQVIAGRDRAAGEIGYYLRSTADVGLRLDQRMLLEDAVSGQAVLRHAAGRTAGRTAGQATGQAAPEAAGHTTRQLTSADVFAATDDDQEQHRFVRDFLDELAFHLVNIAILLNPARIVVGGGMVRSWERIGPRLAEALTAGAPYPPELAVARFPFDAPLRGAVALGIDAALDLAQSGAVTTPTDGWPVAGHAPLDGHPVADGTRITLNRGATA